ncbi:MAG TPA: ferritin-like domain-containing protein [Myxococcaceae bacterium]|nr:ferritin-like domain-containing protein [Myxococcaceae bacterium]
MRQVLASAWGARHRIETEASLRFGFLSDQLARAGAPGKLVDLAGNASRDETRHAAHCERLFHSHGGVELEAVTRVIEYAPRTLTPENRLTYEVVAQSCVAETQSMATLVTLLGAAESGELKSILHELARDEVNHSRLGWAYLAWARPRMDLAFLSPLLPGMIDGSAGPEIFTTGPAEADDPSLLAQGVIPRSARRRLYVEGLESVVLPGFDTVGVDTAQARRWLKEKLAAAGPPSTPSP